jgi:hypothetical protein
MLGLLKYPHEPRIRSHRSASRFLLRSLLHDDDYYRRDRRGIFGSLRNQQSPNLNLDLLGRSSASVYDRGPIFQEPTGGDCHRALLFLVQACNTSAGRSESSGGLVFLCLRDHLSVFLPSRCACGDFPNPARFEDRGTGVFSERKSIRTSNAPQANDLSALRPLKAQNCRSRAPLIVHLLSRHL